MVEAFFWGAGGQKLSPAQVKSRRDIAAALMADNTPATTFGGGLAEVGDALRAIAFDRQASAAESEGFESRKAVMDALMANPDPTFGDIAGAMGNDWVASDPASSAILQAMLGQEMKQSDPMYQIGLETAQAELEALRNPQPDTSLQSIFDPETGREQKGYFVGTEFVPVGGIEAPDETAGVVVNNNMGATDKFYDELDKGLAGQTVDLINAGRNAQTNNIKLNQLESLLQTAPQGAAGAMTIFAGNLGIPTEGLDEAQAAQALINQLVPEQRPPGSGPMSDADLALFKQSVPRIINQPGGNALILQTMKAINEYTIAQSTIAQQVANREISPAEGRALQAQVPNPLEGFGKRDEGRSEAGGEIDYNAGTPPEGWGGDPELWRFMSPEDRALW